MHQVLTAAAPDHDIDKHEHIDDPYRTGVALVRAMIRQAIRDAGAVLDSYTTPSDIESAVQWLFGPAREADPYFRIIGAPPEATRRLLLTPPGKSAIWRIDSEMVESKARYQQASDDLLKLWAKLVPGARPPIGSNKVSSSELADIRETHPEIAEALREFNRASRRYYGLDKKRISQHWHDTLTRLQVRVKRRGLQ